MKLLNKVICCAAAVVALVLYHSWKAEREQARYQAERNARAQRMAAPILEQAQREQEEKLHQRLRASMEKSQAEEKAKTAEPTSGR